jgi:hypothetical protein
MGILNEKRCKTACQYLGLNQDELTYNNCDIPDEIPWIPHNIQYIESKSEHNLYRITCEKEIKYLMSAYGPDSDIHLDVCTTFTFYDIMFNYYKESHKYAEQDNEDQIIIETKQTDTCKIVSCGYYDDDIISDLWTFELYSDFKIITEASISQH